MFLIFKHFFISKSSTQEIIIKKNIAIEIYINKKIRLVVATL